MSEPPNVEETVDAKGPVRYISPQRMIGLLLADYALNAKTEVNGVEWPRDDHYGSYDFTGLPVSREKRDELRQAIKDAFDRHFPVASVTFHCGQDDFSVVIVANRFSDRAPLSLRTY